MLNLVDVPGRPAFFLRRGEVGMAPGERRGREETKGEGRKAKLQPGCDMHMLAKVSN